jgi:DNA-binding transcriptional LysR family regulator
MMTITGEPERYRFDVSLEDLQTFLAVAELGSFSRAAEQLHLSQPSISNRIRRLEEKLLTRLLDRTTRRVELSPNGRRLYLQSSDTLAALRMLLREFTGEAAARAREVHVAATMMVASLGLPRLVRSFHEKHPGIRVVVHDLIPQQASDELVAGNCDLAVMARSEYTVGFSFEPLFDDACVAVTQRGHQLLRHDTAPLAEILREPLLIPRGQRELYSAIEAEATRHGLEIILAPEAQGVGNTFTLLAMAAAGLGVCIHPRHFIPGELEPTIGFVPIGDASIVRHFGLLTVRDRQLSPAARGFHEFMRRSVKPGPKPWHPPDGEL